MVATCSPHRSAGGTIHYPSPTHIHHHDPTSAIRSLRRSLSRSPSRGPAFRLVTSQPPSPSPRSPLSPSPPSPPKPTAQESSVASTAAASASPLAIPFPPSAKIHRSSVRKGSPMRVSLRSRISPSSPARRPLAQSKDGGNAASSSPMTSKPGGHYRVTRSASPADKHRREQESRRSSVESTDSSLLAPNHARARIEKANPGSSTGSATTSSPLKRSDGLMDLDQAHLGSPVAKRRSLHGPLMGSDFNIFEHGPAATAEAKHEKTEASQDEDDVSVDQPGYNPSSPHFSTMPKRSSSLRKSTLQQRHNEKPTFARARLNPDLAMDFVAPGTAASKSKAHHRLSLENFLPPMQRESPFAAQGSLPNASVHVVPPNHPHPHPHPHPLSHAMTQSSSGSSLVDDSPTHPPIPHSERPGPPLNFSASLPVGSSRPPSFTTLSREPSVHTSSTEPSFVTPHNYKLVKPLPAAFMSTGLISKRSRNPEEEQFVGGVSKAQMPDTPCKRPTSMFQAAPAPVPGSAFGKSKEVRHEFGTPSTPFNPHPARAVPGTFGKGVSVFGSGFGVGGLFRRGSFASVDGEEQVQSPSGKGESQSSEYDLPPTPTKQILGTIGPQPSSGHVRNTSSFGGGHTTGGTNGPTVAVTETQSSQQGQSCKSSPNRTPTGSVDGDSDSFTPASPTLALALSSSSSLQASVSLSLAKSCDDVAPIVLSPTPLSRHSTTTPELCSSRKLNLAETGRLSTATPEGGLDPSQGRSPHTPKDNILPPDPSGLSISGQGNGLGVKVAHDGSSSASMFPPATPTAVRDYFPQAHRRRTSVAPLTNFAAADVDASLSTRFEKVELIGTGEFSQVYRVTESQPGRAASTQPTKTQPSKNRPTSEIHFPDRVFAVKKSRHAYAGIRDRQRKLQEVTVLKSLKLCDHVVHFVDSWEDKNHLYIQTEFCEEGSLDMFLAQVGRKARLDDFRIWKVLLELCQVSLSLNPNEPSLTIVP